MRYEPIGGSASWRGCAEIESKACGGFAGYKTGGIVVGRASYSVGGVGVGRAEGNGQGCCARSYGLVNTAHVVAKAYDVAVKRGVSGNGQR